jgi:hypothetical protein
MSEKPTPYPKFYPKPALSDLVEARFQLPEQVPGMSAAQLTLVVQTLSAIIAGRDARESFFAIVKDGRSARRIGTAKLQRTLAVVHHLAKLYAPFGRGELEARYAEIAKRTLGSDRKNAVIETAVTNHRAWAEHWVTMFTPSLAAITPLTATLGTRAEGVVKWLWQLARSQQRRNLAVSPE